jgi:hypothetical protein
VRLSRCSGSYARAAVQQSGVHRIVLYNSIFQADDQLVVSQHAYGISDEHAPVHYLRSADDGDLVATYLDAFDRIWAGALSL